MNQPNEPRVIYRLVNPYLKDYLGKVSRVQMDISTEDYAYLFRGILSGEHGTQAAVIGTLIKKLINELRNEQPPIEPHYDPDNAERVAAVLARLNFNPVDRRPVEGPVGEAASANDAGRVKRVRASNKGSKDKPTDTNSKTSRRVRHNPEETKEEKDGGRE